MSATDDFIKVFDEMFVGIRSVADQINAVQTTYDALVDTVEEYGNAETDDLESVSELLVACIGATASALRLLKMHLEDTSSEEPSNPGGLE